MEDQSMLRTEDLTTAVRLDGTCAVTPSASPPDERGGTRGAGH